MAHNCVIENLTRLKNKIQHLEVMNQCLPNAVHLLAVSKTKSVSEIEEAIAAEQFSFGENYIQEAIEKIPPLNKKFSNLEWHYLGKIQKNKIKDLVQYFDWVQTIEDVRTAEKLNTACEKINKKINVCLQVNVSCEVQKSGAKLNEAPELARYIVEKCPNLCLRGLMAIGLATQDKEALKVLFHQLRCCYEGLKVAYVSIDTLSMGMSADMALAIECGSTMVRIGSAIFGERVKA